MEDKKDNTIERWQQIFHFIKGYATKHKLRNTLIALSLAVQYHKDACRDGGEPYIIHPLMVTKNLILLNIEKTLRQWHQIKEDEIRQKCDILYAAGILHDVIEDGNLAKKGRELVDDFHLDEEVLVIVLLLSKDKNNYIPEVYYSKISERWETTLLKIADRANNCSTMQVFKKERLKKYINETQKYFYPLCREGKVRFPEFSNSITIMKNLIISSCETVASLIEMSDCIIDDKQQYQKAINFIKGASRDGMPNTHKAVFVANMLHEGQKRKSGDPFIIHPLRVSSYLMSLGIEDDITCATALLHEITKKCDLKENGMELVEKYGIDKSVIEMVWRVANKDNLDISKYYEDIMISRESLLVKLSNRVHTCTRLVDLNPEEIKKYIEETRKYMVPMCEYGIMHYPEYSSMIEIMEYHITSTCNIVETLIKEQTNTSSEEAS